MKKNLYTLGLLLLFTASGYAQSLALDTKSSKVKWTGEEITTKQHYGSLAFKSGRVVLEDNQPQTGTFVVDMTSLRCEDLSSPYRERLEGHLRSDDFFSIEAHPEAVLELTTTTAKEDGSYNAQGKLTIKDITHPVVFVMTPAEDHWIAKLVFDRSKYEVRFRSGSFFENLGDKLIYDDITIETELVFSN